MIAGFSHVNLRVGNVGEALEFYRDLLGLEVLKRPDFGPGREGAWLRVGDLQLHLSQSREDQPIVTTFGAHVAFHVPRGDYDALVDKFRSAGIEFVIEPSYRDDFGTPVVAAFIRDPYGNYLEFTDVGPLS